LKLWPGRRYVASHSEAVAKIGDMLLATRPRLGNEKDYIKPNRRQRILRERYMAFVDGVECPRINADTTH